MKATSLLLILFVLGAIAVVYFSLQENQTPEEYANILKAEREAKDTYMKTGEDSPFKESREPFSGLKYFPPDRKFKVEANLVEIDSKKMVLIPTSDGKEKSYLENAYAEFELEGASNKLLILEVTETGPYKGTLFLSFADETSAKETYGAGRYLDVKKVPGATTVTLDFNKSYNPYCAYADNYSCPFPPPGNILKVAIRAGEKNYREDHH